VRELLNIHAASVRLSAQTGAQLALNEVSLRIAAGERIALVGANGSGKSTLLRLINGLLLPVQGDVHAQTGLSQAMLFQRPHMLRLSVLRHVALGLWLRGASWSAARVRALDALQRVGLAHLADQAARTLSVGQQQRVAMAQALALQPALLLLDEPTASLDPHAKREVEALMEDFARSHPQAAMVFASHNLGQVKRLAQRVVYLEGGWVLADLPVADFFNPAVLQSRSPSAHLFTQGELA
jgi:tungstate transport system ATP-binding protein